MPTWHRDQPGGSAMPDEWHEEVLHARLEIAGAPLTAAAVRFAMLGDRFASWMVLHTIPQ